MMEEDRPFDVGRMVLGTVGVLLLVGGVAIAIWAVGVINQALYHPADIPLLQPMLVEGGEGVSIDLDTSRDGMTFSGSRAFVLVGVLAFLMAALGAIVSALITGGVRLLLGDPAWGERISRRVERRRRRAERRQTDLHRPTQESRP